MKTLLSLAVLLLAAILMLDPIAGAHGGTFRGPGGGGGGGGGAPGDTAPPSGGSNGGGASSGGGSSAPSRPGGSGSTAGGSGGSNRGASTPSMPSGGSGNTWEPWWAFNRDPFLNLKAVIHSGTIVIGSDTFFLGYSDPGLARDHLGPTEENIHEEIVPALRRILETETDNDVVTGALVALAKIGENPAAGPDDLRIADTIRPFLGSANQEISETAALSLGILGDEDSVGLLSQLLHDTEIGRKHVGRGEVHWRTRAFATYGLGLIGYRIDDLDLQREILDTLKGALDGGALTMATPDVAVACLTAFGLVPLEMDVQCQLQSSRPPGPVQCRHGQVRWLRELSKRPNLNYIVRAHVPTILARLVQGPDVDASLRHDVAKDLLVLAAGGSSVRREVQISAVIALGLFGTASTDPVDQAIVQALKKVAKESRQPQVRTLALVSLGQAAGRRGKAAYDREGSAKVQAFFMRELEQGRSTDRAWVALGLALQERMARMAGEPASADVAQLLRKKLTDAKSPSEVGAYSVALGIVQDLESAKILRAKLNAVADDRARGYICLGLGLMDARESVGDLRGLLEKARYRPVLMRESAIALGLIGDKDVVHDLVKQLHQATSLTAQSSIAAALGAIGDARSVEPLLDMLKDKDINVRARAFAAVALGIVADKEPLPWNAKIAVGANYIAGTPTLTDGQGAGVLDIL